MGASSTASGSDSIAVGTHVFSLAANSMVIGWFSTASAQYSTAIGRNTYASGVYSIAIGYQANTNNIDSSIALGPNASPFSPAYALAFGLNTASVETGTLGTTVNGEPYVLDMYPSLYAITSNSTPPALTYRSSKFNVFTSPSTTVQMPDVGGLQAGNYYEIVNFSSGTLTVTSHTGATITTLSTNTWARLVCFSVLIGNGANAWMALTGGSVVN